MLSVPSHSKTTANMTEKGQENNSLHRLWQGLLEDTAAMQLLLQFFLAIKRKLLALWDVGSILYTHYTSLRRRHVCISSLPNMSNLNTQSISGQVYIQEDLLLPCLYVINPKSPRNTLLRIWGCFAKFQCFRYKQEHWFFPSSLWLLEILRQEAGERSKTKDVHITFY